MDERLVAIDFYFAAIADTDGVWKLVIPFQLTLVDVEYTLHTVTGDPTGANIDIQDDTVDAIIAIALAAFIAGSVAEWKSNHMAGGEEDPVNVVAGSVLEIDLNLTGGTTPTAGLNGTIWGLVGGLKA